MNEEGTASVPRRGRGWGGGMGSSRVRRQRLPLHTGRHSATHAHNTHVHRHILRVHEYTRVVVVEKEGVDWLEKGAYEEVRDHLSHTRQEYFLCESTYTLRTPQKTNTQTKKRNKRGTSEQRYTSRRRGDGDNSLPFPFPLSSSLQPSLHNNEVLPSHTNKSYYKDTDRNEGCNTAVPHDSRFPFSFFLSLTSLPFSRFTNLHCGRLPLPSYPTPPPASPPPPQRGGRQQTIPQPSAYAKATDASQKEARGGLRRTPIHT